ncbi:PTS transporter subunit EIIC [Kitasatospora sp. NPDC088783]|uniref:PTS transporter subunit EIIC n=1 Tax=Kitasatospora sp. NPDC088783 TaxID=3364077 RepID=UPI003810B70B
MPALARLRPPASALSALRRLGAGLALPIAALPAAGLMLRLGQDDLLGRFTAAHTTAQVLSAAGAAVLDQLPLLFAVGIALGVPTRTEDRATPVLACLVSYLVLARTVLALNPHADAPATAPARWPYGALAGIAAALLALGVLALLRRRPRTPQVLVFAAVALTAAAAGVLMGAAWPAVEDVLARTAAALARHSVAGGAAFGLANRLLLPLGLHQVPSATLWFVAGDCGAGIHGDIPCFFQRHDPRAGTFMSGFFPIAMAGLPAAALAMWRSAHPAQRRRTAQLLLPAAAMSALTGVTEPIELAFAFTAFPLYVAHALLTASSLALANALDIHAGFVFSAGALDWALNYPIAHRPLLLLPLGALYAAAYYTLFRFAITRFDLRTPGRHPGAHDNPAPATEEPQPRRPEGDPAP